MKYWGAKSEAFLHLLPSPVPSRPPRSVRRIKIKSAQGQESQGQISDDVDVDRRDEVPPCGNAHRYEMLNLLSTPRSEGLFMTPSGAQRCSGVQVLTRGESACLPAASFKGAM